MLSSHGKYHLHTEIFELLITRGFGSHLAQVAGGKLEGPKVTRNNNSNINNNSNNNKDNTHQSIYGKF